VRQNSVVAVEVTDEQLASAKFFRCQTLLLKKNITTVIFHEHFQVTPQLYVCPRGKCSMQYKIALEWDEAFKT
jgi:hypothetical protein